MHKTILSTTILVLMLISTSVHAQCWDWESRRYSYDNSYMYKNSTPKSDVAKFEDELYALNAMCNDSEACYAYTMNKKDKNSHLYVPSYLSKCDEFLILERTYFDDKELRENKIKDEKYNKIIDTMILNLKNKQDTTNK